MAFTLLQAAAGDPTAGVRDMLTIAFLVLSLALILFVLFRQTDSSGLAAAFGGGGGGEGAFGAKSQKVADKVIAWMCGLFIALSLLLAYMSKSPDISSKESESQTSENQSPG